MSTLRYSLAWSAGWIKRRFAFNSNSGVAACASPSCADSKRPWRRWRGHEGILLDGRLYCRPECAERALSGQLSRLLATTQPVPPSNRIPLGLLMVARGKLTHKEVRAALEAQRRARYGRIGEWFEKLGFASEQDVTAALALQWGCPIASSFVLTAVDSPGSIPHSILEAFQMLPVSFAASTRTLYVAFGERVDHAALYAIERTLNCRTQPCVARRKRIAHQLEAMRSLSHPYDVEFVTHNSSEVVRITSSYISRLTPEEIRVNRIGSFIWLRLTNRSSALHFSAARSAFTPSSAPPSSAPPSSAPPSSATNLVFRLPARPQVSTAPSLESRYPPMSASHLP